MSWNTKRIPPKERAEIIEAHKKNDYGRILQIVHEYQATSYDYCCPTSPDFIAYVDALIKVNGFD